MLALTGLRGNSKHTVNAEQVKAERGEEGQPQRLAVGRRALGGKEN
jgi:hypothetical protein